MATCYSSKPTLSRIDTTMVPLEDQPLDERLVSIISRVLEMPRDDIELYDSFTDLGGDDTTALSLAVTCSTFGMTLSEDDIIACRTIAELQTRVRPSYLTSHLHPSRTSSLRDSEDDASSRVSETFSEEPRRSSDLSVESCSSHSRNPSRSSSSSKQTRLAQDIVLTEELLISTSQVPQATLIRPKAGYFEGKLVVFITLLDISRSPEGSTTCEIEVIPQSYHDYAGAQVAALRTLLENSTTVSSLPDAWIILQQMPLTETGACDRRRLQTWIQNMNEELYQQIMSIESQDLLQEPSTDMERSLQKLTSSVLKVPLERVGMNFSFNQLGGDEFSALQLVAACKAKGIALTTDDVAQSDSIAHLAFLASFKGPAPTRWEDECREVFKLSPIQQLYFQTGIGGSYGTRTTHPWDYRFNQSMLLKITTATTLEDVHAAVEAVVGHHSMLRARFRRVTGGGWAQSIQTDISDSYRFGNHIVSNNDEVFDVIRQAQSFIDIETGPLFAAEYIRTADGQNLLYVVAHHLVVDLISWRVIIHDINELLQSGSLYSERSMPFNKWNEMQESEIQSLEHTFSLNFNITAGDFSFWGVNAERNTYGDAAEISFSLAPELTTILQTTCNQAFRTESSDIYLTTLLLSFCQTFPERAPPVIWNQEHGREPWSDDIDIGGTVGWFTTLCPLWLGTDASEDLVNVLRRMKDTRRSIPRRGWAYFASRFLGPDADQFQAQDWPFEIMFTYAGSLQQLEVENGVLEQLPIPGRALGSMTSDIGSRVGRVALFEVSTMIDHGVAKVKFLYNKETNHQDRILSWISNYEHLLLEAIGRLRYRSQELTLADVPLLNTNYDGLAKLNTDRLQALSITSARDIENVYPATAAQQEILISQSKDAEICHIHAIFEFAPAGETAVDTAKICSAWQQTVIKHAALRTVFIESVSMDGLFDQVVLRKTSPDMLFIDVGPGEDATIALNTLPPLKTSTSEPRHRLSICKAEDRAFLKLEISLALCDAVSLDKIASDLKRAYSSSRVSPPKTAELSYPAYIQSLSAARVDSKVDFWKVQLKGSKPCLFPKLWASGDGRPQMTSVKLDTTISELDDYCRASAVKRSTVLRLAWGLVLRAYTGVNKVCFGYKHSGRDAPHAPTGIDTAVGAFESTVVCSMDLCAHKTLTSVIQAAEEQLSLVLPHQFTPPSEIQHALGFGGKPLFNTCLSFLNRPKGFMSKFNNTRAQSSLECIMYYNTSDYDLSVSLMVNQEHLEVALYNRILTQTQAENVANAFGCAVKAVMGSPNGSVGGVDLFSDRDYAQLPAAVTSAPNNWDVARPKLAVHEMFEAMVSEDVDAPAIAAWDGKLSYRQMSNLVSLLAHHLVELGVEPGLPVPVILGKTKWSAIAIMAVLKAGGCFVPLDEEDEYFSRRIVKQLKAKIVVSTDMASKYLESLVDSFVLVNEPFFGGQLLSEKQCPQVDMSAPACLIFLPISSKSREAKGIFFTHDAFREAFSAQGSALGIGEGSRVLQLSSFTSDTSISEVLTTLAHGGCVCVPSPAERVHDLTGAIQRLEVNWTYVTPVLARKLKPKMVSALRTICFRTRRLDEDTFRRWAGKTRILLSYGTSDICPLGISVTEVTDPDQLSCIAPPFIGKFWIVNPEDHRRLMPIGAIGELVIESPTLAHKLMREHTPAETLKAQATTHDDAAVRTRFFKTGHRVRYMNDGTMEFITSSRDDVSLNGNVIPVPVVEQHLRRCLGPGVEVVVDAVDTSDGANVLAAFIELGDKFDGTEDLAKLSAATRERTFMARKLAESYMQTTLASYMMPAAFVPVRELPMTSSLKTHRRKLQKMASQLSQAELLALASVENPEGIQTADIKPLPLTQVEERMRSIWAGLLGVGVESISGNQSFLRLGGDTHLVGKLVVACRKEGLIISLADVLRDVSLTELCQSITLSEESFRYLSMPDASDLEAAMSAEASASIKYVKSTVAPQNGIPASSIADVAIATATQVRSLEAMLRTPRSGVNSVILNITGFVDHKKLEAACKELTRAHPILKTGFVTHRRRVYQVVSVEPARDIFSRVQCPAWRLAALVEKTTKKDQAEQFPLSAPATKFTLLDGGKNSALVIRLSTAQYDDTSLPLLLQDLKRVYAGSGAFIQRPSFADFARCTTFANAQGSVDHWASLLQGAAITPIIPHARPAKPLTSPPRVVRAPVTFPSAPLLEMGITFDTLLKSAWAVVLSTLSASPDVVFGEVVECRHLRMSWAHGVSAVLGPLGNTLPVRVRFADTPSTALSLMRCVHEQRLAGVPHENLGTLELVEKCTPWPYWSRFSTVVRHRQRAGLGEAGSFSLSGAECRVTVDESSATLDLCDLLVESVQACPDVADLSLSFCESRIPVPFVEAALRMLVSTIEVLSTSLNEVVVPSSADVLRSTPQIPLPDVDFNPPASPTSHLLSFSEQSTIQTVVAAAWTEILDPRAHGVPESHLPTAAFYDLWGSLIPASQLASRITSELARSGVEGVSLSTEEVVEHCSQGKQIELIARKLKPAAARNSIQLGGGGACSVSGSASGSASGVARGSWRGRGMRLLSGSQKDKEKENKYSIAAAAASSLAAASLGASAPISEVPEPNGRITEEAPIYTSPIDTITPVTVLSDHSNSSSSNHNSNNTNYNGGEHRGEEHDVVSPLTPDIPIRASSLPAHQVNPGSGGNVIMRKASRVLGRMSRLSVVVQSGSGSN